MKETLEKASAAVSWQTLMTSKGRPQHRAIYWIGAIELLVPKAATTCFDGRAPLS